MAEHSPFHVQLERLLLLRFWTQRELLEALRSRSASRNGASTQLCSTVTEKDLAEIITGRLAPTVALGEEIAHVVIGPPERLTPVQLQSREDFLGAAYVAESHGRRQQPPYIRGVVGEERRSTAAASLDDLNLRRQKVREQQLARLAERLLELDEKLARRRSHNAARGRKESPGSQSDNRRPPRFQDVRGLRRTKLRSLVPSADWEAAAAASLAFAPDDARDPAASQPASFLHVLDVCCRGGDDFAGFLSALLNAWRPAAPSPRGRSATRLSPEQLGSLIAARNRERCRDNSAARAWFRRHNGFAVTGNALRNYLTRHSERPQRDCLQKMIRAFVIDGEIQLVAELRLWRMAARSMSRLSSGPATVTNSLPIPRPAVDAALVSAIDDAIAADDRSLLMRSLVSASGMPISRIAELTEVHESLFHQWMHEGTNRRIDDRDRAIRIVDLLNPPTLALCPGTPAKVQHQNERAVRLLTSNVGSLADAFRAAAEIAVPPELASCQEAEKTFRAATLLRLAFGRDSLTSLSGPEVGRLLEAQNLGDLQTFRHLREGIRCQGRKSARRASPEQASFLASLLQQSLGNVTDQQYQQFVERVACVDLDSLENLRPPAQLLRQVNPPAPTLTVGAITCEIMQRRGGLARFSREVGISQPALRAFVSRSNRTLHHRVARRLAERGMGFAPGSEEFRQFVIHCTTTRRKSDRPVMVRLSDIFQEFTRRQQQAETPRQMTRIRAAAMRALLTQAALSPRELAAALGVSPAVVAGWVSPRGGHFTSHAALNRFIQLMDYEAEQIEVIAAWFGPHPIPPDPPAA